jgi:hypothetical protein
MSRLYLGDSGWVEALRKRFGIDKPQWAGLGEWDEINDRIRREHPVGWFFTETLPDCIEAVHDFITAPYYKTRYYIRNRFYRRTHVLRTDCPPGEYWDTDSRILTGMANAVIDFVEIELAYKSCWCATDASKNAVWQACRCPELGLDYLRQEREMVYDENESYHQPELLGQRHPQAIEADEILAIYNWAKDRNNRPDPHDASGWTEVCEETRVSAEAAGKSYLGYALGDSKDSELAARSKAALDKSREIEKQYDNEDTDMLIRIVKLRHRLWA